jgi:G protein-coupled receptor GPR1|tara:strand:+ start:1654 stop:2256 length:603 start_codon:yes stop_codon:yes gene_type:complete
MFIYPLVYTLMWLIPFVQHCMMYSDYFAGHPIFSIRMGTVICTMSIGFVDCLIFTMREKPWRSIQTSDGSIWGSFFVWRGRQLGSLSNRELVGGSVDSGTLERIMTGSVDGVGMRRGVRTSASDDHTKLAVEQARVRLDLEREERLERLKERMAARQAADLEAGSSDYGSDEEGFVERDGEAVGAKEPKGKEKLVGPVIV